MPVDLNHLDLEILNLLQKDASLTTAQIAERLNLSQSPCCRKIQKIEKQGLIDRRVALLNRNKLGMDVVVFTTINLNAQGRQSLETFEEAIKRYPQVTECYTMAGIFDYMIKVITRNIREYESFVRNHLTTIPNIKEFHSHIAVTEIKNTTELYID